ncbi:MAG: hypothetical protein ACPLW9_02415 [Minisyncoccales bacterium]
MLVFEFQFNPPKPKKILTGQEDFIFRSFSFQPNQSYEKKLGYLYIVGLLKNTLPKNNRFLDILAQKIKNEYYQTITASPEKSLQQAIKTANEHLARIAKEGDVSWLGNLGLAVISLIPQEDNGGAKINFTKVGEIKFLLIKEGQIIDIDQQLKFQEIEPYPLKIFGSFATGQLTENDIIFTANQTIYEALLTENLINEMANKSFYFLNSQETKKNTFGRWLTEFFSSFKDRFNNLRGICLLIALINKKERSQKKEIFIKDSWLKHLVKNIWGFRLNRKKPSLGLKTKSKKIKRIKWLPQLKLFSYIELNLSKIKNLINQYLSLLVKSKKKIIVTFFLLIFLLAGYFYFQKKEEQKIQTYQNKIAQIQKDINLAESYFVLIDYNPTAKKDAKQLYEKIWNEISLLLKTSPNSPITQQLENLKNAIKPNLYQLNNLVEINDPLLVFEFKAKEFVPERMLALKNEFYFFNPYNEGIFVLTEDHGEILKTNQKINLAASLTDLPLFFTPPNQLMILHNNQLSEPIFLEQPPFTEANFSQFVSYNSQLYFLDTKHNSIIKYPLIAELKWGKPEIWLETKDKPDSNYQSMAIDGSVWLLTTSNHIEKYYTGQYQKTINLEIFPPVKNLSKILTNPDLPYLYFLEPVQKRIIIADKTGQIIKQYQSEKFDNLLDLSVTNNGKTIWLLNGLRFYRLDI